MTHIIDWKFGTTIPHLKPARFIYKSKEVCKKSTSLLLYRFSFGCYVNAGLSFVSELH